MEHPHHDNPILAFFLSIGALFGVAGLTIQGLDLWLGIGLKIVSIISFVIAIGYTIWKWRDAIKTKKKGNE